MSTTNSDPLTGEVLRGGAHSAPLEEGVCVGVHHQQTSHAPSHFNGRHYFWVCIPFHWHAIHLREETRFIKTRQPSKLNKKKLLFFFFSLSLFSHRREQTVFISQDFFANIITLSARGSQGRKSCVSSHKCMYVCARVHTQHKHTHTDILSTSNLQNNCCNVLTRPAALIIMIFFGLVCPLNTFFSPSCLPVSWYATVWQLYSLVYSNSACQVAPSHTSWGFWDKITMGKHVRNVSKGVCECVCVRVLRS